LQCGLRQDPWFSFEPGTTWSAARDGCYLVKGAVDQNLSGNCLDALKTVATSSNLSRTRYTTRKLPTMISRISGSSRSGTIRPECGDWSSRSTAEKIRATVRSANSQNLWRRIRGWQEGRAAIVATTMRITIRSDAWLLRVEPREMTTASRGVARQQNRRAHDDTKNCSSRQRFGVHYPAFPNPRGSFRGNQRSVPVSSSSAPDAASSCC
jgi:hypothetical protein